VEVGDSYTYEAMSGYRNREGRRIKKEDGDLILILIWTRRNWESPLEKNYIPVI